MAKRGELARESVKNTIVDAFSKINAFVTIQDKKIYVTAKDGPNGEVIQFAIAMTMPKTPVAGNDTNPLAADSGTSVETVSAERIPITLDDADRAKIEELKRALGVE